MEDPPFDQETECLTPAEAAKFLNVSVATIYQWKRQKMVPYFQPAGPKGKICIPKGPLSQLMTGSMNQPKQVPPIRSSGPMPKWMRGV